MFLRSALQFALFIFFFPMYLHRDPNGLRFNTWNLIPEAEQCLGSQRGQGAGACGGFGGPAEAGKGRPCQKGAEPSDWWGVKG